MSTTLVRRTTKVASPLVPIWRDVPADLDTPVSAYLKLARGPYSYLLESVEGGERLARYSFVGVDPYLVLTVRGETAEYRWLGGRHPAIPSPRRGGGARPLAQPLPYEGSGARGGVREYADCHDPLELLQRELARRQFDPMTGLPGAPGFHGGAVGYLAYEVAARFEPSVPVPDRDALGLPEAVFLFSDTLLIFDHVRHTARLVAHMDVEAADGDAAQARTIAERHLDVLERRLRRGRTNAPARAGVRPCVPTEAAGINLDPAGEAGANPAASSGFPSPRRGGGRGVGSGSLARVHEVGLAMSVPMVILALLSLIGGFEGTPWYDAIGDLLAPAVGQAVGLQTGSVTFYVSLALGLGAALVGIGIAWMVYGRRQHVFTPVRNPLYQFVAHRWYVDDLFNWVIVQPVLALGRGTTALVERVTLDGGGRGLGWATARMSAGLRTLQTGYVRNYALGILLGAVIILLYFVVRL